MRSWNDYKKTMNQMDNIWTAAKNDDRQRLGHFLDLGQSVDATDHRGYSPLMLAAYHGSLETVRFLLDRGANPSSYDASGNSVLMGSSFKGHLGVVEALLAAGALVAHKNSSGMDSYDFAVTFGRKDVAELLLIHGARPRKSRRIGNLLKLVLGRLRPRTNAPHAGTQGRVEFE